MTQYFPNQTVTKMPQIFSPDLLDIESVGKLTEYRINPVTNTAYKFTMLRMWVFAFITERSLKVYSIGSKLLFQSGNPVIPVSKQYLKGSLHQFRDYFGFMLIGGSKRKTGDYTRPGKVHMQSKTVESLSYQCVMSVSGFTSKPDATIGSCKLAGVNGHTIDDSESRVILDLSKEMFPEHLLNLPKIRSLTGKSSTVYLFQSREEVGEVTFEVPINFNILVKFKELVVSQVN
jgi:hypothetical protein